MGGEVAQPATRVHRPKYCASRTKFQPDSAPRCQVPVTGRVTLPAKHWCGLSFVASCHNMIAECFLLGVMVAVARDLVDSQFGQHLQFRDEPAEAVNYLVWNIRGVAAANAPCSL
jgi:hypothetical protein